MARSKRNNRSASDLLRPFRGRVLALCVFTVLSSVLQIGLALITRALVDSAIGQSKQLYIWGGILLATMLLLVIFHSLYSWMGGKTADLCAARLRYALLQRMVYGEEDLKYHSGEVVNRAMEDVRTLCDGMVTVIPSAVGQLIRLIGSFAVIMVLFPSVIWVLLVCAVLAVLGAALYRPIMKKHHMAVRAADEQIHSIMQEDLQNLELIKALTAEKQAMSRFDLRIRYALQTHAARRKVIVGRNAVISGVSQLGTGALLFWGAYRVAVQGMSYGNLAAMLQLISLLRNPVLGLSGLWTRLSALEVAKERLEQTLADETGDRKPADIFQINEIVFEDVTFSYPDEDTPVLQGFSARFALDRWTCVTGISGRGKTTLFKLILGLYQPQAGRVYLRTDKGEIPCTVHTRHLFAYVPQNYALLSGSILDNLLLASPNAGKAEMEYALHLAQAEFVWELPEQCDTLVRENNAGLSMGQLQRLAIARAILMDRPVLLLDECTSALDSATEEALLQALLQMDKQGVLVTHRPNALEGLSSRRITTQSI